MDQKEGYIYQQPPPSYETSTRNYPQHSMPPPRHPPMMPPPQPMPHVTYPVQPTVIVTPVGPHPVYVTCPACRQYSLTRMEYEPSTKTHLMAALLCIVGCFFCAFMPYCLDSCMNGNHYCSNCGAYVGTYTN